MASVVYATGSPTPTGTTEYSLAFAANKSASVKTDPGTYVVTIDSSAILAGELYTARVYEAAVAGGTSREMVSWPLAGPGGVEQFPAPGGSLWLANGFDITVQKVSAAADRALPHTIERIF